MSAARPERIVCFGELMLRLTAPKRGLLLQTSSFEATFGGAEANVAVSLAHLGTESAFVTVLPENALGRSALAEIRKHGVDTHFIRFAPGRLGLYFVTQGAGIRASEVLYDRAHSAFADAPADLIDWGEALKGAARLHISGVTPAIGPSAAAVATRAAQAAARQGVKLSFDGNYRETLWSQWKGNAQAILQGILAHADIAFIDERDLALILGETFDGADEAGRRRPAAARAFERFAKLERIACTLRRTTSSGGTELSASLYRRSGEIHARPLILGDIVDRIGAGDAFAAGLLHALARGLGDVEALDFGLAAAAYKHSVPGDFSPLSEAEVMRFLREGQKDVRR